MDSHLRNLERAAVMGDTVARRRLGRIRASLAPIKKMDAVALKPCIEIDDVRTSLHSWERVIYIDIDPGAEPYTRLFYPGRIYLFSRG